VLLACGERPLSTTAAACGMVVTAYATGQMMQNQLYVRVLDYPDATTLVMICGLIVAGLIALRRCSDMQAVAFAWVVAVSCLIAYEAVYKWSEPPSRTYDSPAARTKPTVSISGATRAGRTKAARRRVPAAGRPTSTG
jgi:hypothetical protein